MLDRTRLETLPIHFDCRNLRSSTFDSLFMDCTATPTLPSPLPTPSLNYHTPPIVYFYLALVSDTFMNLGAKMILLFDWK